MSPSPTTRLALLERLRGTHGYWDVVVIGGGATGLGTAVDAVARGYSTLLLDASDFGKGDVEPEHQAGPFGDEPDASRARRRPAKSS